MANMFIVSCRKDFWSTTEFSGGLDIRDLDMTGDGSGASVTSATFLQAIAGKRVMVLVHGYNNDRLDVLDSYGTIERQMRLLNFLGGAAAPYDAIVGFAWPGGSVGVSFPFARGRAGDSAPHLARLLGDLRGANATVDLNTHSLGAHVAFEALRDVPANTVRTAWNFASAVDNESVEEGERYHTASQGCSTFYVFHSKNDPVLRIWYRIGDFRGFRHGARLLGTGRSAIDHGSLAERPRRQLQGHRRVARRLPVDGRGVVVHGAGTGRRRRRRSSSR